MAVPAPVTAEATGSSGAIVDFTVTASDTAGAVTCTPSSSSTFPLGTTTVTCSSTDTHGNTGTASFTVTVVDTTPPTLSGVPTAFTVDATGPGGAVVTWAAATATDLVDGSLPVTCLPATGSTFAIGDTTVTCTATDAHGNSASASFTVHVRGVAEQLASLLLDVTGLPPGKSLAAKVKAAQRDLAANNRAAACSVLGALSNEARAQSGKQLTAGQSDAIVAAAERIRATLGCRS